MEDLEYTGLMALAWDPMRGDTSDWEDRALFLELIGELGQPVLDVGCGTGRLLLDYLALGIDIDGLEISPDMLDILRSKAAAAGLDVDCPGPPGRHGDVPGRRGGTGSCWCRQARSSCSPTPWHATWPMGRFHDWLLPGGTLVMPWIDIPQDYPDGGEDVFQRERTLADGALIRRSYRAWYDASTGLEHTDDRYELVRDGVVVAQERKLRSPAVRQYDRDADRGDAWRGRICGPPLPVRVHPRTGPARVTGS